MRSQVQASEMRFLRRIEGVTLFNKLRSSEIRKSLNIEPLLLRIERLQRRWFGHVSRMPQKRLPKQALHAKANRPFAVNSSVHLVKKFEWQLIFCLNTLIFISQTHMQKFSTYFPAVFF